MFVRCGIGVGHAILAEEVACIGIVGVVVSVPFGVESVTPACDGGIRQAVEGVISEGLGLRPREGIHDGFDVSNRVVIVGGVLELRSRRNLRGGDVLQASAVYIPVVVVKHGVDLVRAANQLHISTEGIINAA